MPADTVCMRLPRHFRPTVPTVELVEWLPRWTLVGGEMRRCVIVRDKHGVLRRGYLRVDV